MSTGNPHSANGPFPAAWPGAGSETYEQLLALADKIGAAYAEASQQMNTAYAAACQKLAQHAGGLPHGLSNPQQAIDPSALSERLDDAQERAAAVAENLTDMGIEIGLAYLTAFEEAALTVAKCQEQLGVGSRNDLVKAGSATGAELLRKVTRAGTGTIRDMAG